MFKTMIAAISVTFLVTVALAEELNTIKLPVPDTTGGIPLMQALKLRHSTREFEPDTLTTKLLSNLLWAACGINRAENGKRTAPSAMNKQEIDLYVATAHGLYIYDPKLHSLKMTLPNDIRAATGVQDYIKDAPINFVYVADYARIDYPSENDKLKYTSADAAFIAQNVYLFAASEGLATVVRGAIDTDKLAAVMKLGSDQHIVLAQTIGYPAKK
jgi:SagB-type dehydrogenase family enzyme